MVEHKVIVVKSNGSELEKALNKGWVMLHFATSNSTVVYVLQKRK